MRCLWSTFRPTQCVLLVLHQVASCQVCPSNKSGKAQQHQNSFKTKQFPGIHSATDLVCPVIAPSSITSFHPVGLCVLSSAQPSEYLQPSHHRRHGQTMQCCKGGFISDAFTSCTVAYLAGGASDKAPGNEHATLLRDRLLVAANAALVSLTGNPDTHFGIVNEGAAPALVATLQHGMPSLLSVVFLSSFAELTALSLTAINPET